MKKSDFESLQRGMAEAKAYLGGARQGYVAHEPVDVRRVRASTRLTRAGFAARYGLDARAVEQWEQGRRKPERGTEMYLRLIGLDPERVAEMVAATGAGIVHGQEAGLARESRLAEDKAGFRAQGEEQGSRPKRRVR